MLGLKLPTDPRWAALAAKGLPEILTDHAWCEQKAASHCISLIQKYPEKTTLVNKLTPVVSEEWSHFRMVLEKIKERGFTLGRQRKDRYVGGLHEELNRKDSSGDRLLHQLLVCALIEARSCERFRLLHEHLEEESLKKFYYDLMVSEAGHYRLFLDLAEEYYPAGKVKSCWKEWLECEKKIIGSLEVRGDLIH